MDSNVNKSKNLLVKLAKAKAKATEQAEEKRFGILGQDISKRFNRKVGNTSYTWRGGRNGQGKP